MGTEIELFTKNGIPFFSFPPKIVKWRQLEHEMEEERRWKWWWWSKKFLGCEKYYGWNSRMWGTEEMMLHMKEHLNRNWGIRMKCKTRELFFHRFLDRIRKMMMRNKWRRVDKEVPEQQRLLPKLNSPSAEPLRGNDIEGIDRQSLYT